MKLKEKQNIKTKKEDNHNITEGHFGSHFQ